MQNKSIGGDVMATIRYTTKGVCSRAINLTVEDGIIKDVSFDGGCSGNTQGVAALVKGMKAEEAVKKLSGIKCGQRQTSCPDQLSKAIAELIEQNKK